MPMINQLTDMADNINDCLRNWIPVRLSVENDILLFRWLYTKDKSFTEPFFGDTIVRCLQFPQNSQIYKCCSTNGSLVEWAAGMDAVPPAAFIFHVSRCGSTLVSQALAINKQNISLSEVPLFDVILRLPLNNDRICDEQSDEILAAAIKFYGIKRTLKENKLFIKTDSWHLLFYKRLRALYPETPFIVMYRNPGDVLNSNKRSRGMQAIPHLVEPSLYGFDKNTPDFGDLDLYMTFVLEKFYNTIIEMATTDARTLLVNYNEGLSTMMQRITRFTGIQSGAEEEARIAERSLFHAKYPGEKFVEKNVAWNDNPRLDILTDLYGRIDMLRVKKEELQTNATPFFIVP